MEMHGKAWGRTGLLYSTRYLQAHLLEVNAGGFCSEHRHGRKHNFFHVLKGRLEILVWPNDQASVPDVTVLGEGGSTSLAPGVYHQFRALADTLCIEIYEAAEVEEDIARRTEGGKGGKEWAGLP